MGHPWPDSPRAARYAVQNRNTEPPRHILLPAVAPFTGGYPWPDNGRLAPAIRSTPKHLVLIGGSYFDRLNKHLNILLREFIYDFT